MLALALALVAAPPAPASEHIVYDETSAFAHVFVVDGEANAGGHTHRFLRFDSAHGDDQSEIDLQDANAVPMEYIRVATAGLAWAAGHERALVIGAGGGTFPMLVRRHVPAMRVDAVDIDPVVLAVAQKYFGVAADAHLALHAQDGAAFVHASHAHYDVILLDAYSGTGVPAHLTTRAFFSDVRAHTAAGGVVVANLALDDAAASRAFVKTFAAAFPACRALSGHDGGNLLLVGFASAPPTTAALTAQLARATADLKLPFDLAAEVDVIAPCTTE
jgi:spermidine synthase